MFQNADRKDAIEAPIDFAVIAELETNPVCKPRRLGSFARELHLFFRECDRQYLDIRDLGDVERHAAPAATELKDTLAGSQH